MPAASRRSTFVIPDTTLLGVSAPRPVGGYTETILRVIDVIFGASRRPRPSAPTAARSPPSTRCRSPGSARTARRWVMFCFFGGGLGGNPEGDGLNHGNNPISTATIPPLEILESLYPVMFTQWALRPDSGGRRQASRRARRDLRDRGAGRRRRRSVPARRARQVSAVRRERRRSRLRSTASSTRQTMARRRRRSSRR